MSNRPTVTRGARQNSAPARPVRRGAPGPNISRISDRRRPTERATTGIRNQLSGLGSRFVDFTTRVFAGQSMLFIVTASVAVLLAVFGVIMVLSASSIQSIRETGGPFSYFWRQGLFAVIGILLMMTASLFSVATYERFNGAFFAISAFLQLIALVAGKSINGNKEWIPIGPFTIQPGEFLKLAVIISMASHFHRREGMEWDGKRYGWVSLTYVGISAILIMGGRDLGTTMVLIMIALVMLWLSEVPGQFMRFPLIAAIVAVAGYVFFSGSRSSRIDSWLHPGTNDQANSLVWQSMHGIWALANSNGIGRGLGMSNLKWSWIPEVQNDYIFAIIGEELGIAGAVLTVALFVLLGYLILQIAYRAQDLFSRMVCYGVAAWFVIQSVINISVVLTLLPVLGVPLPLISYGGSSLIIGMAAVGVVLSIERRNHAVLDGGRRGPLRGRR